MRYAVTLVMIKQAVSLEFLTAGRLPITLLDSSSAGNMLHDCQSDVWLLHMQTCLSNTVRMMGIGSELSWLSPCRLSCRNPEHSCSTMGW